MPGYIKFTATESWFTGALNKIDGIIDGTVTDSWDVATATSKRPEYQSYVTGGNNYYNRAITNNLILESNIVTDSTLVTFATTYTNSAIMYTFNDQLYDNTKTVNYDYVKYNMDQELSKTNKKIDTLSYVKNEEQLFPVYVKSASDLIEFFNSHKYKKAKDDGYLTRDIYICNDIDFTSLFTGEDGFKDVVLPNTFAIYLINGAKITGIPDSVLVNAVIVDFAE